MTKKRNRNSKRCKNGNKRGRHVVCFNLRCRTLSSIQPSRANTDERDWAFAGRKDIEMTNQENKKRSDARMQAVGSGSQTAQMRCGNK
jgi:hypothetical protein